MRGMHIRPTPERPLEERVKCPQCGSEHALLEPSFRRPDAVVQMPEGQRESRIRENEDLCTIQAGDGDEVPRFFLRTVLPVSLTDCGHNTQWGLWVEVDEFHAKRVWDLWNAPDQVQEPPFPGFVANHIHGYPETVGLPVAVHLTGPKTRPRATFPEELMHPFAAECRAGVTCHRVEEWLAGMGVRNDAAVEQ